MMTECMEGLNLEYLSYVKKATNEQQEIEWDKLTYFLHSEGDWTMQGAEQLVSVVQSYGSFFLKNAFSLALASKIQDGRIGL